MHAPVVVDVEALSFAAGVVIPFLVAIFTKDWAPSSVKVGATVVLGAGSAFLTVWIANGGVFDDWKALVIAGGTALITAWSSYESAHKKIGSLIPLQRATESFGVGPSKPLDWKAAA